MELLKLALRNLTRRRVRTSLTILGVMMAIAFTVGLLSISEGFIITTNKSIARQGEHILVLPKETAFHPMPMLEAYGATFPQELLRSIQQIENVKAVYPVFTRTLVLGPEMTSFVALNGVTPPFVKELRPFLQLERGRLLEEKDEWVLVAGSAAAKAQKWDLGTKVTIRGRELEVVGILQPIGGLFEDFIAYAPLKTVQQLFDAQGELGSAAVIVKDLDRAAETAREITHSLPGVVARTLEESLGQMMDYIRGARAMHFSVASIALLIGILFVLSTMMMAVSERVKEIGTMRAIGASRRLIFRLILTESLIIGLTAGMLGCAGGFFLSKLIAFGISKAFGVAFLQTMVTARLVALGLLTALLIGTLAGLYPAWRISKANIVESLRYE